MSDPQETGFGDWPAERLREQAKHMESIVAISAGQADHALLREELDALKTELTRRGEVR